MPEEQGKRRGETEVDGRGGEGGAGGGGVAVGGGGGGGEGARCGGAPTDAVYTSLIQHFNIRRLTTG